MMPTAPRTHRRIAHPEARAERDRRYDTRRKQDDALRTAQRIRNSNRWKRFVSLYRAAHPLCCDPFNKHEPRPMCDVHHVVGLATAPARAYDMDNVAPLCRECHAKVEAMERSGKQAQYLFKRLSRRPEDVIERAKR